LNAIRSDITRGAACAKKFSLSPHASAATRVRVTDFCGGAKVMNGDNAGSCIRVRAGIPQATSPQRLALILKGS
jgi:hypothetical protein